MKPASDFAKNATALRSSMNDEYCFYYSRYKYILENVLITAATSEPTITNDAGYKLKKQNAAIINQKLNQILQIMQGTINSRLSTLHTYYGSDTGVNELNSELDDVRSRLVEHSKKLTNVNMEKEARSSMVDYSLEKNSSSRNLLAIYTFMNIVAGGLLFYLYRSSRT
jgi:hypothetical protein